MADLKTYDLIDLTEIYQYFKDNGERRTLKRGECFCRMECPVREIALVTDGVFGFSRPDSKGRTQILTFASTGEFVGAVISLRPTRLSGFDVKALCRSEVLSLPMNKMFDDLEDSYPGFRLAFTDAIAYGFMMRGISFRCDTPEERYSELLNRIPNICTRVSMASIASYLGISREAFARMRGRFSKN